MNPRNMFLLRVGVVARKNRKRFWDNNNYSVRISSRFGRLEAGLWFRTQGCWHDHQGGCIMCDYSIGPYTTSDEMIQYVREGLNTLKEPCQHLLVSPSGSMLDEWEVPPAAREGIFKLIRNTNHETFSFETRADTVTKAAINQCKSLLGDRLLKVYVGLESANPWISKYCINKGLSLHDIKPAFRVLKQAGVRAISNILVGSPFLSVSEAIEDTVQSVLWALDKGADECCLFPIHVKNATPLLCLYQKGLYSPPSLWSLVEVLQRLGPEVAQKHIKLSWYTSYGAFNVVDSPTTCDECYDMVISLLDKFVEFVEFDAVRELVRLDCMCKKTWYEQIHQPPTKSLPDRVATEYELLAQSLMGRDWWKNNRQAILGELYNDATKCSFP